jgi:hypothetical protein
MYTFEQLKEDVRKEAEALKIHATKEEMGRLDIKKLNPANHAFCVYGMATGSCVNERAAYLVDKCAVRYFEEFADDSEYLYELVKEKPEDNAQMRASECEFYLYSAIEIYIALPEANNAGLIAFLRGETENLEL